MPNRLPEQARQNVSPQKKAAAAPPEAAAARSGDRRLRDRGLRQLFFFGFAQHVAAAPDGLDVIVAVARHAQLLAELADEDVDDLEFGLVHPAVEVVEEHFLGERGALAQAQQLEHRIFLARQMDARARSEEQTSELKSLIRTQSA